MWDDHEFDAWDDREPVGWVPVEIPGYEAEAVDLVTVTTPALRAGYVALVHEQEEGRWLPWDEPLGVMERLAVDPGAYAWSARGQLTMLAEEIECRGEVVPFRGPAGEWVVEPLVHRPHWRTHQVREARSCEPVPAGYAVSRIGAFGNLPTEAVYDPSQVSLFTLRRDALTGVEDAALREQGWCQIPGGDLDPYPEGHEVWVMDRTKVGGGQAPDPRMVPLGALKPWCTEVELASVRCPLDEAVVTLSEVSSSALRAAYEARSGSDGKDRERWGLRLREEASTLRRELERRGEDPSPVRSDTGPGYQLRVAGDQRPVPAGHTVTRVGTVKGETVEAAYDPARVSLLPVSEGLNDEAAAAGRERGWDRIDQKFDFGEVWVMDRAAVAAAHIQRAAAGGPHDLSVA